MATTVHTGWRSVTPGPCDYCGYDNGYTADGSGTVFCDCRVCPECGEFDECLCLCDFLTEEEAA